MARQKSTTVRSTNDTPHKVTTLALPTGAAVENGTSTPTNSTNKVFEVTGITTATVHVDGSADGVTNWTTLGNVTANGKIANSEPWPFVRARISAHTTGTVVVKMCE